MKKFKAFTLIELLVTMAVSGIVLVAGYASYGFMRRNFYSFKNNSDQLQEVIMLKGLIHWDIARARTVQLESDYSVLITMHDSARIEYTWQDEIMIRNETSTRDTLHIEIGSVRWELIEGAGDLVRAISFDLEVGGEKVMLTCRKDYPADILLNSNSR